METINESASESLIETFQLTKQFGRVHALSDLNLCIKPGEVYGLLGPNGAGKTTTIKTILGLLEPTSGSIKVAGFNPATDPLEVKARIGYVSEAPVIYDSLSPRDFLEFVASIRKIETVASREIVARLGDAFDMAQYFDSPMATLSLGMKQKVALIAAFIHRPTVLLLDEPLNGLDAKSSRLVKDMVSFHAQKGGAVLFSTHIMEVAQQVCTRIGIIYQGRLVAEGTFEELRDKTRGEARTLEEVFLKLTNEESDVADTSRALREVFFKNEIK